MEDTEAGRGGWSLRRLEAATGDGGAGAGDRGWKSLRRGFLNSHPVQKPFPSTCSTKN